MSEPLTLTIEQQFSLRSFEGQVKGMSREQAQEMLVSMYRQMLVKEGIYKNLLKHNWGLD